MNRVVNAARLYLITWQAVVPWSVMTSALVINLVVYGSIQMDSDGNDNPFTGGLLSLYATVALMFVTAMNRQLSFALGFGLSRTMFFLGTTLFALGYSFGSAAVLLVLRTLENATDGWWVGLPFFEVGNWDLGNPVFQLFGYAVPMLALIAIGMFVGGVYARWGTIGTYVAGLIWLALGGVFVVLMSRADAWSGLGDWFTGQSTAALLAGYPWILVAVFGGGAYLVVRRANA